jgi:hypothetical protein
MRSYMRLRNIPRKIEIKIIAYLGDSIYQKLQNKEELEQELIE